MPLVARFHAGVQPLDRSAGGGFAQAWDDGVNQRCPTSDEQLTREAASKARMLPIRFIDAGRMVGKYPGQCGCAASDFCCCGLV